MTRASEEGVAMITRKKSRGHTEYLTRQADPLVNLRKVLQLVNTAIPDSDPTDARTWAALELLRSHVAFAAMEPDELHLDEPMCGATDRLEMAEPLMAAALVIFRDSFGNEHPKTQTVMQNYQLLLVKMGLTEDEAHAKIQAKLRGDVQ